MRAAACALALMVLVAPRVARSDEPAAPTAASAPALQAPEQADPRVESKAKAAALFDEGNRLLGEASYPEALEKFQAAYALYQSPKLLLNIGTTLRQLGRNAEAAKAYEAYLRVPAVDASRVAEVRRVLAEIDSLVGRVRIDIEPGDAKVSIDGGDLAVESAVARARVEPGDHLLTVQKQGMSSAIQKIRVAAREESHILIRLTAPDKRPVIVMDSTGNAQKAVGWTVAAAGMLGIVASTVTGISAFVAAGGVREHCYQDTSRCDSRGVALANQASSLATASTASFVVGVTALAAGVGLLLTVPSAKDRSTPSVRVTGSIGAQGAMGAIVGAW
jgi:hypothetical protein